MATPTLGTMEKFKCDQCRKCSLTMTRLVFVTLMFFIVACSNQNRNIDLAKSMFEAFNRHDWKAMAGFYAPSAEFLDPSFGKDYVTRPQEQTSSKYAEMQSMFPDIHDDVREI